MRGLEQFERLNLYDCREWAGLCQRHGYAPLASVVSFQVDITGVSPVSDGTNAPISVLNGTQTVDSRDSDGLRACWT